LPENKTDTFLIRNEDKMFAKCEKSLPRSRRPSAHPKWVMCAWCFPWSWGWQTWERRVVIDSLYFSFAVEVLR